MNQYNVTIRAVITKTMQVMAEDAGEAEEIAHQEFTVDCDGDEDYSQDVLGCEEIKEQA